MVLQQVVSMLKTIDASYVLKVWYDHNVATFV